MMKTHKGIKHRFKVSARGKVIHRRPGTSHLNAGKTSKRRRNMRKDANLADHLTKKYCRMMGA